jgi:FlaA1/EpsC-like NDP-sugar epimerase
MKIAITGGTGTLGKALTKKLQHEDRIVILSRDEFKQYEMKKSFPEGGETGIRYFIGDIRDKQRLIQAFKGIDYSIFML